MQLKELTTITDNILYSDTNSYKVITSKQKELLEFIGANKDISKINVQVINKYIEHLKNKGNNNATINSKLAYLSKILTYAYQNEIINHKP